MSSEARLFLNLLTYLVVDGALIGACAFAWLKGRPAERYGALAYVLAALASLAIQAVGKWSMPMLPTLGLDSLVALVFLVLALRYNNLWLGAAMMLKGVQLGLHATHLTVGSDSRLAGANLYYLELCVVSVLISATLFAGTLAGMRERRRDLAERDQATSGAAGQPGGTAWLA
jgi:hypothetical protein